MAGLTNAFNRLDNVRGIAARRTILVGVGWEDKFCDMPKEQ